MKKTFVLDTNILLHNPGSIHSFEENKIVIPMQVIEELDKFKTQSGELGRNARKVIRDLDEIRSIKSLREGAPIGQGGMIRILTFNEIKQGIDFPLPNDTPDNKVLGVAYILQKKGENVFFVSKDINARIKADAIGVPSMDFKKDKVNYEDLYSGLMELEVDSKVINDFFDSELYNFEDNIFLSNQFVLLKNKDNPKHTGLARALSENIITHLDSSFEKVMNIKPKNMEQRIALELLMDPKIEIVTLCGSAGTGKTLLALACALEQVINSEAYDKLLVSRPIMPFGKDLGYLPGDKDDKLHNWMQPIFDNLNLILCPKRKYRSEKSSSGSIELSGSATKKIESLLKDKTLELEALTYIRGRSIPRQYMIIDEAQNLTPHEVKTIISRAGHGTKIVLTGDPDQIDSPYLDAASNGLVHTVEKFKEQDVHGHITLRKSERSNLAGLAAQLL